MPKFEAAGVRLYAISYDDKRALREFAEKQSIPFPLLSDVKSQVIRRYGILNDAIDKSDAFLFGIPFPGAYVTDEAGKVVARFFHQSYKKRDSPEVLLDAALGRIEIDEAAPRATGGESGVRIEAAVHGGRGTIRQGVVRQLVVSFELEPGLHLYTDPVPEGLTATQVRVSGPPGFVTADPILPATKTLRHEGLGVDLETWEGRFEIVVPFHADGRLASETRPLDTETASVEVEVRYQACNEVECLLPRAETLRLEVPLDVVDVPKLGMHNGHGQREGLYDAMPHMRRLFLRKARENPVGILRFVWKKFRMEREARRRLRDQG